MEVARIKENVVDILLGQYNGSTLHRDGNPLSVLMQKLQEDTLTTTELVSWTFRCCAKSRRLFAIQGIRVTDGDMQFVRAYLAGLAAGLYGHDEAQSRIFLDIILHPGARPERLFVLNRLGIEHGSSVRFALLDSGVLNPPARSLHSPAHSDKRLH